MATHFEIFIKAFATAPETFRRLDGDYVLCRPSKTRDYPSTPRNSITFADMGVDGVHYAILKIRGAVRDDSPVVQVCPMDSEDVFVLAESFLLYLSRGCGVSKRKIKELFEAELRSERLLVRFLRQH